MSKHINIYTQEENNADLLKFAAENSGRPKP